MRLPDLHPILPKRRIGQSVDIISAHNIFSQIDTTCPTPRADRGKNSTPPAREEVLEMSKMLEVDSSFTKEASRNHGTRPSGQATNQPPMCVGFHYLLAYSRHIARFRRNGITVACAAYGWWRPRRYKVMWDAWKFARICQRFGWSAWRAPYEARQEGISPEAEGRAGWPNEVSPQGRKSPSGHHRLLVPRRRFAQAEHRHGHPDRLRPRPFTAFRP